MDCKTEREANIFAAHLLISDASLALYRRNYGNMDISGASAFFGVTPELVSIKLGRI
ncbi:MAG: ImmA/IrrE family metallo-endopeptidase [Ruminococcaceae bacterium]|nr:ImmA/IrrE family metallo-endopeptidase [Oscillospiraceae bacterium]